MRPCQHGQPIHQRHADVGNDQIRLLLLAKAQGVQTIFSLPHHGKAVFLKGNDLQQSLANVAFIVRQQQPVHDSASLRPRAFPIFIVHKFTQFSNVWQSYSIKF